MGAACSNHGGYLPGHLAYVLDLLCFVQYPDPLACLLGDPDRIGVGCATCQMYASGPQLDEEQDLDGFHGEAIACQDLVFVVPQEAAPGTG
jgi:hypothetical protein